MYSNKDDIKHALKMKSEDIVPPMELKNKVFEELELISKDGDMLAKVTIDTLDEEDSFDQIIKQLQPGMGKAILLMYDNENTSFSNQTNYKHEKWDMGLDELRNRSQLRTFRTPVNADVEEVFVMYGFDSLQEDQISEMYEEARQTEHKVVTRDLIKNQTIVGAKLIYIKDGNKIELLLLTTTKNRIHVPDLSNHIIERGIVNNCDSIFLSDTVNQQLLWVEESEINIQYEIRASNVSKDWIFEVAENLN